MENPVVANRRKAFSHRKGIADAVNGLQVLLAAIVFFGLMGLVGGILGLIQDDIDSELNSTSQAHYNLANASVAQGNIFERLGLIGTVIVLVFILILILGVVGYFLAGKYTSGQYG